MAPTDRPVLVGGPLDGATIAPGARPAFIFAAPAPRRNGGYRAKVWAKPGPERHLYRGDGAVYIYSEHIFRCCEGCGGFVLRPRTTCVCGHQVAQPVR